MNPLLRLRSLSELTITLGIDVENFVFTSEEFYSFGPEERIISSEVLPKLKYASIQLEVGDLVGVDLEPLVKEVKELMQDLVQGNVSQETRKGRPRCSTSKRSGQ